MQLDSQKFIQLIRNKLALDYMSTGKMTTLEKASAEMGTSKPTLSRILRGKKFDIDTLFKVASWLGIRIDEISKL